MAQVTPESFLEYCERNLITITRIEGSIVTLSKKFTPEDRDEYVYAENAVSIIHAIPQTRQGGSTWGTTSDGVGGVAALVNGLMVINRSGCSKLFTKRLAKLLVLKGIGEL